MFTRESHSKSESTLQLTSTLNYNIINKGKVVFKINGKRVKDTNSMVIYAKAVNGQVNVEYTIAENMKTSNYTITAVYTAPNIEKVSSKEYLQL